MFFVIILILTDFQQNFTDFSRF